MPQAIPAAIAAAKAAFAYVGTANLAVAAGSATIAQTATVVAVNVAVAVGTTLLSRPNIPTPEYGRSVRRQAIPDRLSGYGRARVGGAYMLYEAAGNYALNVFANHDGLIKEWQTIYLNDMTVSVVGGFVQVGPDLRYGKNSDLVQIDTRLGLPTETNYSQITALAPDLWPANARGDGIASLAMIAEASSKEVFLRDYPNSLPIPSAVGDLQYCWDPRLGARGTITDDADKAASATWVGGSRNPVLQLLDYMTNPNTGLGYPLSRFLPTIDAWIAAADVCDEAVPLAAGGTVPRYEAGGVYLHSTAPADVYATILASFDGWMAQDATGCFTVQAGKYYEPTVTITEGHIINLSRQFFREDEKAANEIVVSYTDPAFDYTEVETTPWRREEDIEVRGEVRSQPLSLPWVQNNSQARRLAKIAAYKATAPISGTITTTLDGLRAWSERRIRIQAPSDGETMADIVVDILPLTLNTDMTVSIPFVSCDPDAYEWTTAEETAGAGEDVRPEDDPVSIPVIDDIEVFQTQSGSTRLRIFFSGAVPSLTYRIEWRVSGETTWTTESDQISAVGVGLPFIETGLVTPSELDVHAQLISPRGAPSEFSDVFNIDASIVTPMGPPTNFNAVASGSGLSGEIAYVAQAPNHPDVDHLIFFAGTTASFGSAFDVSGALPASPLEFINFSAPQSPDTWYVWVEAYDAADVGSGPLGPIVVTIPF